MCLPARFTINNEYVREPKKMKSHVRIASCSCKYATECSKNKNNRIKKCKNKKKILKQDNNKIKGQYGAENVKQYKRIYSKMWGENPKRINENAEKIKR